MVDTLLPICPTKRIRCHKRCKSCKLLDSLLYFKKQFKDFIHHSGSNIKINNSSYPLWQIKTLNDQSVNWSIRSHNKNTCTNYTWSFLATSTSPCSRVVGLLWNLFAMLMLWLLIIFLLSAPHSACKNLSYLVTYHEFCYVCSVNQRQMNTLPML